MKTTKKYFKDVKIGQRFQAINGGDFFTKRNDSTAFDNSGFNIYGFSLYSEVK